MKSAPCKNCEKRYPSCHSKCPDYTIWSNERQEMLKQKRLAYEWSIAHENECVKSLLRKRRRQRRR